MVLLRQVIGDALRARRQAQQRTLRDVSTAANVSLGYLSEVERGQKEASSELLAAICEALGARLSEVLREISLTVEGVERHATPIPPATSTTAMSTTATADPVDAHPEVITGEVIDGEVRVSVRHDTPLRTTLRTTRRRQRDDLLSVA